MMPGLIASAAASAFPRCRSANTNDNDFAQGELLTCGVRREDCHAQEDATQVARDDPVPVLHSDVGRSHLCLLEARLLNAASSLPNACPRVLQRGPRLRRAVSRRR